MLSGKSDKIRTLRESLRKYKRELSNIPIIMDDRYEGDKKILKEKISKLNKELKALTGQYY